MEILFQHKKYTFPEIPTIEYELNPVLEDAFTIPIKDGYARLLKLQFIQCQIENSAPDFINVEEDEVSLSISPAPGIKKSAPTFKRVSLI